ncbi:SirB2 family protein [Alkalimonas delamerensis]|uniref:SirB2 family protein n=1 Tax=Alkalimonas delamerensis TaxID=265981 RepID=A0ABT9GN97_9GAMM|nr:SirB2 family protein [Alkalimonas delamerensis]MDP4528439.1 SirB2 family protein [Alkalimonas delamerensis]
MEYYVPIKHLHMLFAYLTALLFTLRLLLDAMGKPGWRQTPLRFIPHINDTLLLTFAVALWLLGPWQLMTHGWLGLKIVLLFGYIGAGLVALKPSKPRGLRIAFAALALGLLAAIFHLAKAKPMLFG